MNYIEANRCDPLQLIEALRQSGKSLEAALDTELAKVGLSAARWAALRCLIESDDQLPLSQLADKLACVRSNATQLVDRLEADNLVSRVPDPVDRRLVCARLTDQGRARYHEGLAVMQNFERTLLAGFTQDEHLLLSKLLSKLQSHTRT